MTVPPDFKRGWGEIHATCAVRSPAGGNGARRGPGADGLLPRALAQSARAISAAVPMPQSADLPPPSLKDITPTATTKTANAAESTGTRSRAAPAPRPRPQAPRSPTSSATDGRRQIRPHPRRQEGPRADRSVLFQPRVRAALDRRRRDERARQGRRRLSRRRRGRRSRSGRLSAAADQGRRGRRGARRSRNQVHRRGADLRPPRPDRPRALQPRPHRHPLRPRQARPGRRAGEARQRIRRRGRARQLQPAAAAIQGAEGQARRGAPRQRHREADDPVRSGAEVRQGQEGQGRDHVGPARARTARALRHEVARGRHQLRQANSPARSPSSRRSMACSRPASSRRRRSTSSTGPSATRPSTSSSPTWSAGAGCRATSARPT